MFNDQAVAAGVAFRDYGDAALPILIIDLDVHQARDGRAATSSSRLPLKISKQPLLAASHAFRREPPHLPQGNGTASIFEGDPRVITFSMHGARNYPWKSKMRSDYDVDLEDGTGDEEYLRILGEWLPRLFETHKPKLVMFQARLARGRACVREGVSAGCAPVRGGVLSSWRPLCCRRLGWTRCRGISWGGSACRGRAC